MKKLLLFAFLLIYNFSFAQTDSKLSCKIEFYLLKRVIPNVDTSKKIMGQFNISLSELQDTPLIKDSEIISYSINRDLSGFHRFNISNLAAKRLKNLTIPLCCGIQFAVIVNGQICYAGYFWNVLSSFGCDWITAYASGDFIGILRKLPDIDPAVDTNDPRKNKTLLECLKSTNRLIKE